MTSLQVRDLTVQDLPTMQEIHEVNCNFPLPDLSNNLYCCSKVVEDQSGVIGIGIVRLTSESILILDKSKPKTERIRAINKLIEIMKAEVSRLGMDETHAFIDDEDSLLRRALKRMFGFIECKSRSIYLQF